MTVPLLAATEPAGLADAPLVVLGPSLGTSTILWDATASALQRTFRTISWDLPGHGRSPAATEPFTMDELAEGVVNVLDELGEPRALYAGVSLGGAVGLALALSHPERVTAAAIVCSGAVIGTPQGWADRAAAVRSQGTPSLVVPSAQRWFATDSMAVSPDITGRLLHSLRDADDESYALCCGALAGYDVRSELARLTMPILTVWGEFDEVTPQASAAEVAHGVNNGRVAEVAKASHLAPAEQPAAVAELLTAFFEENR
ncbi:MAG: alpha/beta fold hydrolase [Actinomycetota bacterium]|nr:alpha/beta fold hydrolase [Actinomycetota bacterium]